MVEMYPVSMCTCKNKIVVVVQCGAFYILKSLDMSFTTIIYGISTEYLHTSRRGTRGVLRALGVVADPAQPLSHPGGC